MMVAVSVSASLLTVVLSLLLVGRMGISGVALSVLVTKAVSQAIFLWHTSRYLGVSILELIRQIQWRPVLVGAVYFVLASVIARLLGKGSYPVMAGGALLSLLLYVPMAFLSLFATERQTVLTLLRTWANGKKRTLAEKTTPVGS